MTAETESQGEAAAVGDAELVDLMLKGARLSKDKTSNRANMHGALNAIRPYLRQPSPAQGGVGEHAKAFLDMVSHGQGFMRDGKYVPHDEVFKRPEELHTTDAPLSEKDKL